MPCGEGLVLKAHCSAVQRTLALASASRQHRPAWPYLLIFYFFFKFECPEK